MRSSIIDDLNLAADEILAALEAQDDWGFSGVRPGQYVSDLAADQAAVAVLSGAGYGVLSEESGLHHPEREIVVVVDPLDGSTNAHRGIPWFGVSLCAVERTPGAGPRPVAAVVVDLPGHRRFSAERGSGAWLAGERLGVAPAVPLEEAIVGISGLPPAHLGWAQFRALGAAALDLCAVAAGTLDAFVDCSVDAHGAWDYLGGLLVCTEAGGVVADMHQRNLVVLDHTARRTPVAASSPTLLNQLVTGFIEAS